MKIFKDISHSSEGSNREISLKKEKSQDLIVDSLQRDTSRDLFNHGENQDFIFVQNKKMQVSKKITKDFDALENHKNKKKNIIVSGKKKRNIPPVFLYIQRYIKGFQMHFPKVFFLLLFVGVLLTGWSSKFIIETQVTSGYSKLLEVKEGSLTLLEIQKNINDARFSFFLSDMLFFPFSFLPGEKINSTYYAIKGGKHLSKGLDDSMALYEKVDAFTREKKLSEIYFTQLFLNIYNDISDIEKSLNNSQASYQKIQWLPNDDLLIKKDAALSSLSELNKYLREFRIGFREFTEILGHEKRKKYLIVFQNADEIRPTGGFMGSMALVEIFKGQIRLFQKKDVYAIEWDLKSADYQRRIAPKGLNELTDTFGLRDANYFVNIKDSSNAIKFFTDEAGLDIDGVIYINQNILLSLLDITGPIYFEDIGRDISSDNFSEVMSLLVEAKISKEGTLGTPKQILFEFIEVFLAELVTQGKYFDYLQVLLSESENRDLMMWSFDDRGNEFLGSIGLTGNINYESSLDYFYPVYTSLSGNKSDRYMDRSYSHEVFSIGDSCDFNIISTIESSHNMTNLQRTNIKDIISEYDLQSPKLFEIQGAERNRQYVRVILPSNAIISKNNNYDIVDYGKRKGVEFFLETQQQEKTNFSIEYTLPNPECREYNFTLYKQPGIRYHGVNLIYENVEYEYDKIDKDFFFEKK